MSVFAYGGFRGGRSGRYTHTFHYRIRVRIRKGGKVIHRGRFKYRDAWLAEKAFWKRQNYYVETWVV